MPPHREAGEDELKGGTLGLEEVVGVIMRPVPLPVGLLPPETLEGSTPVPAGAVITVDAELVATCTVLVATAVELEMGPRLGRDEPGLGSKVGCGRGGMVTSLKTMLSTSSPTLRK